MTDKEKLAEQYNAFCEAFGIVKPKAILEACVALDKIVELVKADATKWHYPSKGELPTEEGRYLVLSKDVDDNYFHDIGIFFPEHKEWDLFYRHIIAWMPLPEPPKEEA